MKKDLLTYKKIISFYYFLSFPRNIKFKYFFFVLLFLFHLVSIIYISSQRDIVTNSHYIFSFWEPQNSMPEYIKLCIKTWIKYFPKDYKVVILNYNNLKDYLSYKLIDRILSKKMALQMQADAIRVAILLKYGGIWMDCDTIITNSKFMNMFNGSDLVMFGSSKENIIYTGFIYASKNSKFIKIWLERIIKRMRIYKQRLFLKHIFPLEIFIKYFKKPIKWDFLGNGIINKIVRNSSKKSFTLIERDKANALPEVFLGTKNFSKSFQEFYFTPGDPDPILKKCKGVLLLHNSWTESKFRKMSKKEFLHQDIMLVRLLSRLLSNDSIIADLEYK